MEEVHNRSARVGEEIRIPSGSVIANNGWTCDEASHGLCVTFQDVVDTEGSGRGGWYGGLERIFTFIAREPGSYDAVLSAPSWHRDLYGEKDPKTIIIRIEVSP